jgi:hypothetical protein
MLETNIQKERSLHGDLSPVCCLNLVQNKHKRMASAEWARNNDASFNNIRCLVF